MPSDRTGFRSETVCETFRTTLVAQQLTLIIGDMRMAEDFVFLVR